jgi:glycosyltransferase involved in cell wall biosynthesis
MFCKIVNGDIPCLKVYEDEYTMVFMDIAKDVDGHMLAIPKKHIKNILDCDCYIFIRSSDRRNNAGFPTKFAESFTCGVPIITTDVSDVKEYINLSNGSVLLGNCETESILKAMETVFDKSKKPTALKTVFHYAEYKNKAKIWLE